MPVDAPAPGADPLVVAAGAALGLLGVVNGARSLEDLSRFLRS